MQTSDLKVAYGERRALAPLLQPNGRSHLALMTQYANILSDIPIASKMAWCSARNESTLGIGLLCTAEGGPSASQIRGRADLGLECKWGGPVRSTMAGAAVKAAVSSPRRSWNTRSAFRWGTAHLNPPAKISGAWSLCWRRPAASSNGKKELSSRPRPACLQFHPRHSERHGDSMSLRVSRMELENSATVDKQSLASCTREVTSHIAGGQKLAGTAARLESERSSSVCSSHSLVDRSHQLAMFSLNRFAWGNIFGSPFSDPPSELIQDNFNKSYRSHCSHRAVPLCTMDPATQLRHQRNGPITAALTRGSSTRQQATLVLSGANADASQYFSIETRLELKARLTKLQFQLHQLLVQAKLAWMRCFAEPHTSATHAAALQMVQLGEGLTASLSRAFDLAAGTATAPLSAYQALVKRVESKVAAFQNLVTSVAHGSYPHPDDQTDEDEEDACKEEESSEKDAQNKPMTYLNRPMNVDLPSMQTYCKHVAPPYSSYLPNNAAKKVPAAKKRVV